MATHLKRRIPELRFTTLRGIGWHVNFRDRKTGQPRKVRFNLEEKDREAEARVLYHQWLARHLGTDGETQPIASRSSPKRNTPQKSTVLSGCILEIASGLLQSERARARAGDEARRQGTIANQVFLDRKHKVQKFLEFLNERHGANAVSRLRLADLSMEDVEAFNRSIVKAEYSASQVSKHLQIVKAIIDRGGRPSAGHARDAYDAAEAGMNLYLARRGVDFADVKSSMQQLHALQERMPRQTRRDEKQVEFQQFSTPPASAILVVTAAGIVSGMRVLEPSAGTGNIAMLAKLVGAAVDVNEIDERRQSLLSLLGFQAAKTRPHETSSFVRSRHASRTAVFNK